MFARPLARHGTVHPLPIPLPSRGRDKYGDPAEGSGACPPHPGGSVRVFRRGTVAADPGIGPVRNLALVFGEIRAPSVRLDRVFGLPDDVELPVRLDLAYHDRLREVMVCIHRLDEAAGSFHL